MAISVPKGYLMAGVHCRIKRDPRKQDLTLVMSETPASAAGVYTQNLVSPLPSRSIAAARRAIGFGPWRFVRAWPMPAPASEGCATPRKWLAWRRRPAERSPTRR